MEVSVRQPFPLPLGNVWIDADQKKVGPALLEPAPKRARLAPLFEGNGLAMLQGIGEKGARLLGHLPVLKPDHQLIIDIEAALIEIGRTEIDHVINDD